MFPCRESTFFMNTLIPKLRYIYNHIIMVLIECLDKYYGLCMRGVWCVDTSVSTTEICNSTIIVSLNMTYSLEEPLQYLTLL